MPSSAGDEDLIGRVLDERYEIEKLLGRGGMGSVYRGTHLLMGRTVAVKILRPDIAGDDTAVRRFRREARNTFRFDHPNCVRVTDFGTTADGILYLVMDYFDGRTVATELAVDGPLSSARTAHILAQLCAALDHAHGLSLVHRDIKPDNIMLMTRGDDPDFVKVLDFGLAKLFDPDGAALKTMISMAALTQVGVTFGTPHYMSPEQAMGESVGPKSDIYSVGALGYHMVTGVMPFSGDNAMEVLMHHIQTEVEPPSRRRPHLGVDVKLEAILMSCLDKRASQRPASAALVRQQMLSLNPTSLASNWSTPAPTLITASDTVDTQDDDSAPHTLLQFGGAALLKQAPATAGSIEQTAPTIAIRSGQPSHGAAPVPAAPVPAAPAQLPGTVQPALDTNMALRAMRRPRWPAIIFIAMAAVAATGLGFWAVSTGASAPEEDASPTSDAVPIAADTVTVAVDSAEVPPRKVEAPVAVDAGTAAVTIVKVDAGEEKVSVGAGKSNETLKAVRGYIRAAEEARKSNNVLRQMSQADSALQLNSGNAQARFLFGDALLKADQQERGCRELRRARKLRQAILSARRGGCPWAQAD